jgi:multisubunit Na+/H+ antiporter MnhC subunit
MKKALLTAITISALLFSLLFSLNFVKADITDADGGPITKGPYIISPTNTTYSSGFLTLNVSFHAPIYGNINYSMTYSIDGSENETMPLTVHYFGFFQQEKSYIDGLVSLPKLSATSHNITIYLKLEMFNFINNQMHNKTYHDSQTVFFTIMGTASPSLTPTLSPELSPSPSSSPSSYQEQPFLVPTQSASPTSSKDVVYALDPALVIGSIVVILAVAAFTLVYLKKHNKDKQLKE